MGTLVLDFDSTLVSVESLEEILRPRLASRPDLLRDLAVITDLGMSGVLGFNESLARRLALAHPTLGDVEDFAANAHGLLTPGMDMVIAWSRGRGHEVRIVSGALREAVLPLAGALGVAASHVHAVAARWSPAGEFLGLDPEDLSARSKVEAVLPLSPAWPRPRVGVGDGINDLELLRGGALDHFIAFTEHRRREAVVRSGAPEARDATELQRLLEGLL